MENLIDTVRNTFVKILTNDRADLVTILNRNGFVTIPTASDDEIIQKSLHSLQVSDNFRNDLSGLMTRYEDDFKSLQLSKMNFAAQPEEGGGINMLTGFELKTNINPFDAKSAIFMKAPLFAQRGFSNFVSAEGDETDNSVGSNIVDLIKFGVGTWSQQQAQNAAQGQASAALSIEQSKLRQIQAQAAIDQSKSGIIKSYTVPIIVVGVLGIAGIGAYFYFKKAKF